MISLIGDASPFSLINNFSFKSGRAFQVGTVEVRITPAYNVENILEVGHLMRNLLLICGIMFHFGARAYAISAEDLRRGMKSPSVKLAEKHSRTVVRTSRPFLY